MLSRVVQVMQCSSNEEKVVNFNYRKGLKELNFDFVLKNRKIELKSLCMKNKDEKNKDE